MAKKTTKNEHVSLRDYFDHRFDELRNYMEIKFASIEKSTSLAQDNLETRLEGMNEFRASLKDQTAQYITRSEFTLVVEKLQGVIDSNKEYIMEARGKASQQSVNIAYLIAAASLMVSGLGLLLKLF